MNTGTRRNAKGCGLPEFDVIAFPIVRDAKSLAWNRNLEETQLTAREMPRRINDFYPPMLGWECSRGHLGALQSTV